MASHHHHNTHFLLLDASRKPTIRKGVDYQAFVPVAIPSAQQATSIKDEEDSQGDRFQSALSALSAIIKGVPEMGPFSRLSVERLRGRWPKIEGSPRMRPKPDQDVVMKTEDVPTIHSMRSIVATVDNWISRAVHATTGHEQADMDKVADLLTEAVSIEQYLPADEITRLLNLSRIGQTFSQKVRKQLNPDGDDKFSVKVLTELLREAEELPVLTSEGRFLRDQKEKLAAVVQQAREAERSLDKVKDLTTDASSLRVKLPHFQNVIDSVAVSEWAQKVTAKLERRAAIPLPVVEQLLGEPAADLVTPQTSDLKRQLIEAKREGDEWLANVNRLILKKLSSDTPSLPSEIFALAEAHAKLSRVSVPSAAAQVDSLAKKLKAWLKRTERTVNTDETDFAEARALLLEGDSQLSLVQISSEIEPLRALVSEGQVWADKTSDVLRRAARKDVQVFENAVQLTFPEALPQPATPGPLTSPSPDIDAPVKPRGVGRPRKKQRTEEDVPVVEQREEPGSKEEVASRNYQQAINDLERLLPRLPKLEDTDPTLDEARTLLNAPVKLKDAALEEKLEELCDRAERWTEKAQSVLQVPFPRPVGVLRSLISLISDLSAFPLRYAEKDEIFTAAKFEVWAFKFFKVAEFPFSDAQLLFLAKTCPLTLPLAVTNFSEFPVSASLWASETFTALKKSIREDAVRRRGGEDRLCETLEILSRLRQIRDGFTASVSIMESRRPPVSREEWQNALDILEADETFDLSAEVARVSTILEDNQSLEEAADAIAVELSQPNPGLFNRLLKLVDAADRAPASVQNYQAKLAPVVQVLMNMQDRVKALFGWSDIEDNEVPTPLLAQVEQLYSELLSLGHSSGLTESFLLEVSYVGTAIRALHDAKEWLQNLTEILQASTEQGCLSSLRRVLLRGSSLPVQVPLPAGMITEAEIAEIDRFCAALPQQAKGKRRRPGLAEAEELLASGSKFRLIRESLEFAQFNEAAVKCRELLEASKKALDVSVAERRVSDGDSPIVAELGSLLKDARKSPIRVGTESLLDREIHCRNVNKHMQRILSGEGGGPSTALDAVEAFVSSAGAQTVEDDEDDEPGNLETEIDFAPSRALLKLLKEKVEVSKIWRERVSVFPGINIEIAGDQKFPGSRDDLWLDPFLSLPALHATTPDYALPLPLLDRLDEVKSKKNKKKVEIIHAPPAIFSRIPWVNPVNYLASAELLATMSSKTAIDRANDKYAFLTRLHHHGATLESALAALSYHKNAALLAMPEVVRLRYMVDASLRLARNVFEAYPCLRPASEDAEGWEKVLISEAVEGDVSMSKKIDIEDLLVVLSDCDALRLQIPLKKRIVSTLLEIIDWRIRAQCLGHNYGENFRPRPWVSSEHLVKCSELWAATTIPGFADVFECTLDPAQLAQNVLQLAKTHVITIAPPKDFIYGSNNLNFFYVIEGFRHLSRVFSDMCELCCNITTAENDNLFWITCDTCERWFHGPCAALVEVTPSFVCPQCTIASAASTPVQRQAAMVILATCSSAGPKRMGPPTDVLQRVMNEGLVKEAVKQSEPQELGILQRTLHRRSVRQ